MRFTMARPRPVPSMFRFFFMSILLKAWNMFGSSSSGMPRPVSFTENRRL